MKKILILIISILMSSCSKTQLNFEDYKTEDTQQNNNVESIDETKLNQVKNLLKNDTENDIKNITEKTEDTEITNTSSTSKITSTKTPITNTSNSKTHSSTKQNNNTNNEIKNETGILTKEELEIIENTKDGEIDELINILFKDLN
ncbi:MAG: hypothetical protein PHN31_02795 [Candidatus Gracilibacteria bacterium]|nr:hypothetical protein [Candidatus Gracilibacteria bacterium]